MTDDTYTITSNPAWGYGIKVSPKGEKPFVLETGYRTYEKAFAALLRLLGRWTTR